MPVAPQFLWLETAAQADRGLLFHAMFPLWLDGRPNVLGLAVSGGSDSMAMLHLMARAAPHAGWRVEAATVNHRLRTEAAEEAEFVACVCAELGIAHEVLVWADHPATGNLMEAASRARYRLMTDWAKRRGIAHVAVAHTADDQAETFLMGLSRSAGLEGLVGMHRQWAEAGVTFHRPLLGWDREKLRGYLRRHSLAWRDDPSNDDARYARVRARKAVQALAPLGITLAELNETICNLAETKRLVDAAVAESFARIGREDAVSLVLDRAGLAGMLPETQRRLLVAALRWLSGSRHPPRAGSVRKLLDAIWAGGDATLAGCRIRVADTEIRITREPKAVASLSGPTTAPWDTRWHLDGPHAPGLHVAALGAAGFAELRRRKEIPAFAGMTAGATRDSLIVTPAIWRGETLIAAPMAGQPDGWTATLRPTFASFLQSH